jgi:hypothetical protein
MSCRTKVDLTPYVEEHLFRFDQTLSEHASNQEVYGQCVRPLVQYAFQGAKVTCFAYGQTGSGKTYTMNGDAEQGVLGMYHLGAQDIFLLRDEFYPALEVHLSFYEIYCSKLFDLLNGRELLQAREDAKQNVNVVGLTVKPVASPEDFMAAVAQGSALRITSQNSSNADSSRSHAILQIELRLGKRPHGKLAFIDLAGCERGADTLEQNKQTKIDGAEINKSLLALKECIRALDQGKTHTPFRGSKLTMVLKDSFCGFCKTVMIANIAPSSGSCENTLNTLRYADRVKTLKKHSEPAKEREAVPNNYKSRPISSECPAEQKQPTLSDALQRLTPQGSYGPAKAKRSGKYIIKDENEKGRDTGAVRKAFIANDHLHQEPLKSVNHMAKKRDCSRNKSLIYKEKPVIKAQLPSHSERESFQKNHSQLVLKRDPPPPSFPAEESEWERAVVRFHKWAPTPASFGEMSQLFEDMVALIMREEVELS